MHGFQPHPHEGGEQQVVLHGGRGDRQAVVGEGGEPGVEEEEQVEAQQGSRQVDENLGRVVTAQLSVKNGEARSRDVGLRCRCQWDKSAL